MSDSSSSVSGHLDVDRAETALSSSTITRISGPRSAVNRRWFRKALLYSSTLVIGSLAGMSWNIAMEKSGLKDEYESFRNPVAQVESSAVQIQWLQLPSSPFLEAGR